MNILLGLVVTLVVTAITVATMLVVRRRAPEGSYFTDGDRASGVFGVLATGFSVLLGFIIFLAFSSYDESRSGAETEATIVAQQVQTAQFLPDVAGELTGRAGLLRAQRGRAGVGRARRRNARRPDQPVGSRDVPDHLDGRPGHGRRAVGLRPVDGPDLRPGAGADRPDPRGGGHHPPSVVARPVRHLRRRLRLPAVLRRPGRRAGDPRHADGQRHGRHRAPPAAPGVLRPPARRRSRPAATDRDGADPAPDRHPGRGCRPRGDRSLRRAWQCP